MNCPPHPVDPDAQRRRLFRRIALTNESKDVRESSQRKTLLRELREHIRLSAFGAGLRFLAGDFPQVVAPRDQQSGHTEIEMRNYDYIRIAQTRWKPALGGLLR
jgi:hypothetical protein